MVMPLFKAKSHIQSNMQRCCCLCEIIWCCTVQITFIFIDFCVCDFVFAFKTRFIFRQISICVLNANETFVLLHNTVVNWCWTPTACVVVAGTSPTRVSCIVVGYVGGGDTTACVAIGCVGGVDTKNYKKTCYGWMCCWCCRYNNNICCCCMCL